MHEFMGSFLENKINPYKQVPSSVPQPKFNHQMQKQYLLDTQRTSHPQKNYFEINAFSPMNNQSQITFSGSKISRVINKNQESRILKEQHFLLDELRILPKKNSCLTHKKFSGQKCNHKGVNKPQILIEECYKLSSSRSVKRQSLQKQISQKINQEKQNEQIKVQKINLLQELKIKKKSKNLNTTPKTKYNISKESSKKSTKRQPSNSKLSKNTTRRNSTSLKKCHIRSRSKQPKIQNFTYSPEQTSLLTNQPKHIQQKERKSGNFPGSKNIYRIQKQSGYQQVQKKKANLNKGLKVEKTFKLSSKRLNNLEYSMKQIKFKDESQNPNTSTNRISQNNKKAEINPKFKIKISRQKNELIKENEQKSQQQNINSKGSRKYRYQYSYIVTDIQPTDNNKRFKANDKSIQYKVKDRNEQHKNMQNEDIQIHKEREIIREIKKDLTNLIHKISSTSKTKIGPH